MRVKESNKKNTVSFRELESGDCFRFNGRLYIKSNCDQKAVGLVNGIVVYNMCDMQVTPVNAEVQIID